MYSKLHFADSLRAYGPFYPRSCRLATSDPKMDGALCSCLIVRHISYRTNSLYCFQSDNVSFKGRD